jgi:class 3 adenylate cyclase
LLSATPVTANLFLVLGKPFIQPPRRTGYPATFDGFYFFICKSLLTHRCHFRAFTLDPNHKHMQQLTLFTNQTAQVRRRPAKRKTFHTNKSNQSWDLWTQESQKEKEMVLFFLDIRNFTPLAEKLDAPDVIHIVRRLFSTFQNIIRVHRGQIIETSGDGFYAAFGMSGDLGEAVNAAVNAGHAILKTLDGLNESLFEKNLRERINIGIGIHAGRVATGNLSVGAKDHFVVMGYAVNVAARIQAATKEFNNNFIVSSAVFQRLTERPAPTGKVMANLKGASAPMELYLVGKEY